MAQPRKHRNVKRTGICQQYFYAERRWKWGFRIKRIVGGLQTDLHLHEWNTQAEAEDAYLKALNGTTAEPTAVRLTALVDRHLQAKAGHAEYTRAKRVLETWLALLPDLLVTEVESEHLQAYVDHRKRKKPSTIDRDLNIIVACLNASGVYYRELRQWRLPPVPRPKYSKATTRVTITPEQYQALVSWFTADQQPGEDSQVAPARQRVGRIFQFMMLTGARTGEACALKNSHVEWEYRRIKLEATKTDSIRYVPLTEELEAIIREQAADNEKRRKGKDRQSPYLFMIGGQQTPKFYRTWTRACEACGIEAGRETGFTIYCARHTFATSLLHDGADVHTVKNLLGHGNIATTMVYAHASPTMLNDAAERIERIQRKRKNHT